MQYQWRIDFSCHGQMQKSIILKPSKPSVLWNPKELAENVTAGVEFSSDGDEIVIARVSEIPVELVRGMRKRVLSVAHPVRLMPQDTIHIGGSAYHVEAIHRLELPRRNYAQIARLSNRMILTSAAAMLMTVIPACNQSSAPTPVQTTTVEQHENVTQNDINQDSPDNIKKADVPDQPAIEDNTAEQNNAAAEPKANNDEAQSPAAAEPKANNDEAQSPAAAEPKANNDEAQSPAATLDEVDEVHLIAVADDDEAQSNAVTSNANSKGCNNGKVMCLSNNRYKCENHRWKLVEACQKPAVCIENYNNSMTTVTSTKCNNSEPCTDGYYACYGGKVNCERNPGLGCFVDRELYKCENQQWKLQETCDPSKRCRLQSETKAECVDYFPPKGTMNIGQECKSRQRKCDSGNAIMKCVHGFWSYENVCDQDEICQVSSSSGPVCVKN